MVGNILAVGLMSMGMGLSGVKDEPMMYAQDESTYTITYNAEDWQEKADSIKNWLETEEYTSSGNALSITGYVKVSNPNQVNKIYYYESSNSIVLPTTASETFYYDLANNTWKIGSTSITVNEIQITNQQYYEALKETSMGNDIVGTIASGLGIIGALATEFLGGFTALFYSSGNLTPFAIFSLVFLGIAVSFAIVKLVLNIIRGNTGA